MKSSGPDGRGNFRVCVVGAAQKKLKVHRDIFVSGNVGRKASRLPPKSTSTYPVNIMQACVILHNMIIEDEKKLVKIALDLNENPSATLSYHQK